MFLFDKCTPGSGPSILADTKGFWKAYLAANRDFSKTVFGSVVPFEDEPIFPVQCFAVRHGQEHFTHHSDIKGGGRLSSTGIEQITRTSEFIGTLLHGWWGLEAVWSSRRRCALETADIFKCDIKDTYVKKNVSMSNNRVPSGDHPVQHVINNSLDEFVPPYHYHFDRDVDDIVRTEIDMDGQRINEGRWLFSSALRGRGVLIPSYSHGDHPANYCSGVDDFVETNGYSAFSVCRLPPNSSPEPKKVLGVYVGRAPALMKSIEKNSACYLYVGHGNSIRYHLFEELGLPPNFWQKVQLAHGAVVLCGLHVSGQPGMVLGDVGALSKMTPRLPITYTPHLQGEAPDFKKKQYGRFSRRDRMRMTSISMQKTDSNHTTSTKAYGFEREAYPGIRYEAPAHGTPEKIVVMIRIGHNTFDVDRDLGLTALGIAQVRSQILWVSELIDKSRFFQCNDWSVMLVNREWNGTGAQEEALNTSISQTAKIIKGSSTLARLASKTKSRRRRITEDSSEFDELVEYQDPFVVQPRDEGTIQFVVGDDAELLQIWGTGMDVKDVKVLDRMFWPHAGVVMIGCTASGWCEMKLFGQVGHLPVNCLTFVEDRDRQESSTHSDTFQSAESI
eukprot:GHVH01001454.1.p1 GENE.GHVH01001454.1~~GHVH01001454.1.p1  ORF type:complete len:617 (+),score=64.82 GHVH01001454.1:1628-3478(+)